MAADQLYVFGMEVLKETTRGEYIVPTEPLCLLEDTANIPTADYKKKDIKKMTGFDADSYQLILDPTNPKVAVDVTHWLPLSLQTALDTEVGILFESCGLFGEAIVLPNPGFGYTHVTGSDTTFSMLLTALRFSTPYRMGQGSFEIGFAVDEPLEAKFSFGMTQNDSTTELAEIDPNNAVPTLDLTGDTDVMYYHSDNPATVNGNPVCFENLTFLQNNNIVEKECTSGKTRSISAKAPTITFDAIMKEDFELSFNDILNGTEFDIVIPVSTRDGVAIGQFHFPKAVTDDDSTSNKDSLLSLSRTMSLRSTVGDDNYSFEFYT